MAAAASFPAFSSVWREPSTPKAAISGAVSPTPAWSFTAAAVSVTPEALLVPVASVAVATTAGFAGLAVRRAGPALLSLRRYLACHFISRRDHAKAGFAGTHDLLLRRRGYAVGYVTRQKRPAWASAIICGDSVTAFAKRTAAESFAVDPDVSPAQQAKSSDYTNSGYDRGHLMPRATCAFDADSCAETYFMTNVFPQNPELNRGAWKSFENDCRRWATRYGRIAIVVGTNVAPDAGTTGMFGKLLSRFWHQAAAPTMMAEGVVVPTHVFAAVLALDQPGRPSIAIRVKNAAPKDADANWRELFDVQSLNDLERSAGVKIFRRLPWRQRPWFWQRSKVDVSAWPSA